MIVDAPPGPVAPSGMSVRDLGNEALAGLFARPARTVLTCLGTVVGLAALVATLGLSRTAGNQIVGRFDALAATEIQVKTKLPPGTPIPSGAIPWDAPARMQRLSGVAAAGNLSTVNVGDLLVTTSPVRDPQGRTAFKLTVLAASPGLFDGRAPRCARGGRSTRATPSAPTGWRCSAPAPPSGWGSPPSTTCRPSGSATSSTW